MDTSRAKSDKRHHWQKTPQTGFNGSNLVCSTGKKLKAPSRFELSSAASHLSCPHTSTFNHTAKASCSTDRTHAEDACASSCEACDSWLKYKRIQEKLRSYCVHNVDVEHKYNCLHKDKKDFEDNFHCNKEHRRSSSRNHDSSKHLHENVANPATEDGEPARRCHAARHSLHITEDGCQDSTKCNREDCLCTLLVAIDRKANETCNHHSPNAHEEEPLITQKCSGNETTEVRH